MSVPLRFDFPYLMEDTDRHGNARVYVRRKGRPKVRVHALKGTPAFAKAYVEALDVMEGRKAAPDKRDYRLAPERSLGWLATQYFQSNGKHGFLRLDARMQRVRRSIIEECLREPERPGSRDLMSHTPIDEIDAGAVIMLMERKAGAPGAANNRKKYLSSMFRWAITHKHMTKNPARDAERIDYATDGWHTWTVDEIRQYIDRHPIGTKPYLFMVLVLCLGGRRQDAIRFSKAHVFPKWDANNLPTQLAGAVIRYIPRKTRYKRLTEAEKPILPMLAAALIAGPLGDFNFLVTEQGKPYTDGGIGNAMRDWCDQANLHHCTAHGLKKAAASITAEEGATDRGLMSLFDWTTEKQANTYTAKASRRVMAKATAQLLSDALTRGTKAG